MDQATSKYQIKLAYLKKKIQKSFSPEEAIPECYEIPFPANNLKLGPLENEALQKLLDIFRFVLSKNEYSARSFFLVELIIRACPSHYAAFDYRKSYINKVIKANKKDKKDKKDNEDKRDNEDNEDKKDKKDNEDKKDKSK